MGYDSWRNDDREDWWDGDFGDVNEPFNEDGEYVDTPFDDIEDDWAAADDLQYREEVVTRLLEDIEEFLSFSTTRELIKLIGENL